MAAMGQLKEVQGEGLCILEPEHLIGRTEHCSLQLRKAYISGQHAFIRWSGSSWQLLDRGSRNGTFLNGIAAQAGLEHDLPLGSVLAFGHPEELWSLHDASPPQTMVVGPDSRTWSICEDGIIGIPSGIRPESQIYRAADALWKLERPGQTIITVRHGDRFEAAGSWWRFCCPDPVGSTVSTQQHDGAAPATLHFAVSRDEEFVELTVESQARSVNLGSRAHNYLLLTLARIRLNDLSHGVADSSCGWTDKDELAKSLDMTPEQIDGEVFRIRQHFGRHGIEGGATVVERRPRIKHLRLGWRHIKITTV